MLHHQTGDTLNPKPLHPKPWTIFYMSKQMVELSAVVVMAMVVNLALTNGHACVFGIDVNHRLTVDGLPMSNRYSDKTILLREFLPCRMISCKAYGNHLYFRLYAEKKKQLVIWKLTLRQGAGIDWFSEDDKTRHPANYYGYGEGHHGLCSRLAYTLRMGGLDGKFTGMDLCVIDCINYLNQTEGNVVYTEDVSSYELIVQNENWLREFLGYPSPFYEAKEWVDLVDKVVRDFDKPDMPIFEFLNLDNVTVGRKKMPLFGGLGYFLRSEWLGRWDLTSGDDVDYTPLATVKFLQENDTARRKLIEILPVMLLYDVHRGRE
jgi:hypothetical protein